MLAQPIAKGIPAGQFLISLLPAGIVLNVEAAACEAAACPSDGKAMRLRDSVTPPCAALSLVAGAHASRIKGSRPFRGQRIGDRDEPCDRTGSASRLGR